MSSGATYRWSQMGWEQKLGFQAGRFTAVNLALALAAEGARVGLLDADIYGPSLPMMMGIEGRPESDDGQTMDPLENYGVQVMSIGFLVAQDEAMIWRGPMATQALE